MGVGQKLLGLDRAMGVRKFCEKILQLLCAADVGSRTQFVGNRSTWSERLLRTCVSNARSALMVGHSSHLNAHGGANGRSLAISTGLRRIATPFVGQIGCGSSRKGELV
jgi:hypothetical protein